MIEPILKQIFTPVPKRTKEVLVRRWGLKNNKLETLEAIGKDFGVTRERVRQIEQSGIKAMKQRGLPAETREFDRIVAGHLDNFNGAREEGRLLEELKFLFNDRHPASHARIRFLLDLSGKFNYVPENVRHWSFWSDSQDGYKDAVKFLNVCVKEMKKERGPVTVANIEPFSKKICQLALSGAKANHYGLAYSYLTLSKEIGVNPFGEIGLTSWSEIVPKGVRDRVYRILRQEQEPLHFRDLAERLNSHARFATSFHPAWQKEIEIQTVHNELIKDQNFVLVGRGMYALKEWGYEPGTVKDVLMAILKKSKRPMTKEEILSKVQKQRLVQQNTVLINLQDRKTFKKTRDGRYKVKAKFVGVQREA